MVDIVMHFRGEEYRIPDDKAFKIGEQVEEIVTIAEIPRLISNPKFHVIARCYGAMLRFAGCKVSDRDVHAEMMKRLKSGEPGAGHLAAVEAMYLIGAVLMDGAPTDGEGEAPGKNEAS
jgi:hypothetical protein